MAKVLIAIINNFTDFIFLSFALLRRNYVYLILPGYAVDSRTPKM